MIMNLFLEQVKKNPDKIAIKNREESITYSQLNRYASGIAHAIRTKWPRDSHIKTAALLFQDAIDMIAAVLGVLKAGNVYVPLASDFPAGRLEYMVRDSAAAIVLTDCITGELSEKLTTGKDNPRVIIPIREIKKESSLPIVEDRLFDRPSRKENELMYILYTSGSTGNPRGVMQTRGSVLHFIRQYTRNLSITGDDRMTLFSSFSHDAAVMDLYGALLNGATLYPLDIKSLEDFSSLSSWLEKEQISIWHSVPTVYRYFLKALQLNGGGSYIYPHLRFMVLGGEAVLRYDIDMYRRFFPRAYFYNLYGQTESSYNSGQMMGPGEPVEPEHITLGEAVEDTRLFVLGEDGRPVDALETGEIVIAGPYVSPGYWQNPQATEKAFRKNEKFGRLYRTGDLGCPLLDGGIEFVGREDSRVKIRGYRVELGEIESILLQHPAVHKAAVTLLEPEHKSHTGCGDEGNESIDDDMYIAAYVVSEEKVEPAELRRYLAARLPGYMVPHYIVPLDELPLTATGKINRRALPEPKQVTRENYTPPGNPLEKALVEIWGRVVNGNREQGIGIDDNFFVLGGHSLKATLLAARIHKALQVKVPLAQIFKSPTIRGLSRYIKTRSAGDLNISHPVRAVEKKEFYELTINQKRLWLLQQLKQDSISFNMTYKVELTSAVERDAVRQALHKMMERHESLRTSFIEVDHQPRQFIAAAAIKSIPFRFIDVSSINEKRKKEKATAIYREMQETCFDLSGGPLFRSALLKLDEGLYDFVFVLHHIISDGWSMEILGKEFNDLYEGFREGEKKTLQPLGLQYKDFAQWHNRQLTCPDFKEKSHLFWEKIFRGGFPLMQLPRLSGGFCDQDMDNNRKASGYLSWFDNAAVKKIRNLAEKYQTTLFCLMFAIYILWLYRFSNQEDTGCAIIHAGREHEALHRMVGFFVNAVPFRIRVDPGEGFDDFLLRLRCDVLECFQHQSYPPELVCEALDMRYPDINVSFNMLNIGDVVEIHSRTVSDPGFPYVSDVNEVKFDIEPYIKEFRESIRVYWVYRKSMFEPSAFEYMVKEYSRMMDFFTTETNFKKNFRSYRSFRNYKPSQQVHTFKRD